MKFRLIIAVFLGVTSCWATFSIYPYFIQLAIEWKSGKEKNVLFHLKPPNPDTPDTPNPDFLYSALFYDLSKGDLLLTGDAPDQLDYFCIAFYGANSFSYALVKDRDIKEKTYTIRLTSGNTPIQSSGEFLVHSPSTSGTVIVRYMRRNAEDHAYIQRIQQRSMLKQLP